MARVLILFAHPAFQKSRVNRRLLDAVREIPDVTVHDLYEAYPDFHILIDQEQARLEAHDAIIFQYPFYWYSCPALLKEWMDLVLAHGFAYGKGGNKLAGKLFLSAITAGASEEYYLEQGEEQITNTNLLLPFRHMSALCQMIQLPPFVVVGTHQLDNAMLDNHARDYAATIQALSQGAIDPQAYATQTHMNSQEDKHAR